MARLPSAANAAAKVAVSQPTRVRARAVNGFAPCVYELIAGRKNQKTANNTTATARSPPETVPHAAHGAARSATSTGRGTRHASPQNPRCASTATATPAINGSGSTNKRFNATPPASNPIIITRPHHPPFNRYLLLLRRCRIPAASDPASERSS